MNGREELKLVVFLRLFSLSFVFSFLFLFLFLLFLKNCCCLKVDGEPRASGCYFYCKPIFHWNLFGQMT